MNIMAKRFKAARIAKGLSQEDFAKILKVNQSFVSRFEKGVHQPSAETFKRICKALDLRYEDLLDEPSVESQAAKTLLKKESTNEGLKMFTADTSLTESLRVTDDEFKWLGSVKLPEKVRKEGYVQLLITLRAIS